MNEHFKEILNIDSLEHCISVNHNFEKYDNQSLAKKCFLWN